MENLEEAAVLPVQTIRPRASRMRSEMFCSFPRIEKVVLPEAGCGQRPSAGLRMGIRGG